jgi:hypothetical protein
MNWTAEKRIIHKCGKGTKWKIATDENKYMVEESTRKQ